jgi:hypothetical protein
MVMKLKLRKKPRKYDVGINKKIKISDLGKISLKPDEQISFVTKNFASHDVTRKNWGFYATQSINSRLKKRFKTALVINPLKRIFIMLVEKKFLKQFKNYCKSEDQKVLMWLDEF